MKKFISLFILVAAIFVGMNLGSVNVEASSATTTTYTLDSNGRLIATQDAYLPQLTFTQLSLSSPSDLVISNDDLVYISDTGNNRIVVLNSYTGETELIYQEPIKKEDGTISGYHKPNGLFITTNNELYVCYSTSEMIIKYNINLDGTLTVSNTFGKPDSVLFNNRDFKPQKIAVDTGGNMFITGEGVTEGIIQLSTHGEFLGYFTSNKVNISWLDSIKYKFYTDEQLALLPSKNPSAFSSLTADKDGLIYTTTATALADDVVKKHNTAGLNQFTKYDMIAADDMVDIWVDKDGTVYAASQSGEIYIYTSQGEFIHKFGGGGNTSAPDIAGVFKKVSALAVDSNYNIWVLDSTKEIVQTFSPTDYALTIYDAINAYFASDYLGAIDLWNEVIKLNQMSNIAHNNIGLNYLSIQEYDLAMKHLEIANNREDYSTAYWEVRNIWIQSNLTWMVVVTLLVFAALFTTLKFNNKYGFLTPIKQTKDKILNNKYISDYIFMFTVFQHPEDSYYDLKVKKRGSLPCAIAILVTLFISYILFISAKGFIYQTQSIAQIDFTSTIIGFFAILGGFVICNYLVTSITEGNGTIKEIFIALMYACAPIIIGFFLIVILSHFVTLSESFALDAILYISGAITIFTILKGMQEIQGYDLKKLTQSIILTALFMVILIVVLLIIFVLSQDLFNFLELVIKEVFS